MSRREEGNGKREERMDKNEEGEQEEGRERKREKKGRARELGEQERIKERKTEGWERNVIRR
jgi:hypothetical protein